MKKQIPFLSILCLCSLFNGCITTKTPDPSKTIIISPGEATIFQVIAFNATGYQCEKSWSIIDTEMNDDQPAQQHENSHLKPFTKGMVEGVTYTPEASSLGWYKVRFSQKYFPASHVEGVDTDEITSLRETVQWDVVVWDKSSGDIVVTDISYGKLSKQVGVINAGEGAIEAPESFALDEIGKVYACDTVMGRIQIFSSEGAYLRKLNPPGNILDPEKTLESSITAYKDMVYVYSRNETNKAALYQLSLDEKLLGSLSIDSTRWSQDNTIYYKPLHVINDEVYLCVSTMVNDVQINGDVLIGRIEDGKLVTPSAEELQVPVQDGILAEDGNRYPKYTSEQGLFMGLDNAENRYYSKYTWSGGVSTRQVDIYDSKGDLLDSVITPGGDYPFGTDKTVDVTKNGVIVQMMPGLSRMYLCIIRNY